MRRCLASSPIIHLSTCRRHWPSEQRDPPLDAARQDHPRCSQPRAGSDGTSKFRAPTWPPPLPWTPAPAAWLLPLPMTAAPAASSAGARASSSSSATTWAEHGRKTEGETGGTTTPARRHAVPGLCGGSAVRGRDNVRAGRRQQAPPHPRAAGRSCQQAEQLVQTRRRCSAPRQSAAREPPQPCLGALSGGGTGVQPTAAPYQRSRCRLPGPATAARPQISQRSAAAAVKPIPDGPTWHEFG